MRRHILCSETPRRDAPAVKPASPRAPANSRSASAASAATDWLTPEFHPDGKRRDGRLHDARHTAATVLLLLGVHERTIMSVLGWSTTAMVSR